MAWSSIQTKRVILDHNSLLLRMAWEVLSWNLMMWFLILFFYLILLVVHPSTRETTITRLTRIKERDEREQIITGQAARSSFLVTLSLLILLLFVSVFSVDVSKVPETEIREGRTKTLSIGLNFSLIDRSNTETVSSGNGTIFATSGIPVSKSAIVLLIIVCQVGIFGWSARRQHLDDSSQ